MFAFFESKKYQNGFPVEMFNRIDDNFLAHWHVAVEITFVVEGNIQIGINKESRVLSKGDIAIASSNQIHYYDSTNMHSKTIVIIFWPDFIGCKFAWPEKVTFIDPFIKNEFLECIDKDLPRTFEQIFQSISSEILTQKDCYKLYVQGKICELGALLLRHIPTYDISQKNKNSKSKELEKIQKAIEYMEENYKSDISLNDISEYISLSPYYFSRLFHKYTGLNFKDYFNQVRIRNCEHLLSTTDMTMIDISLECGFNSIRTFNRIFKSVKGITPSKHNDNNKNSILNMKKQTQ